MFQVIVIASTSAELDIIENLHSLQLLLLMHLVLHSRFSMRSTCMNYSVDGSLTHLVLVDAGEVYWNPFPYSHTHSR